jgi:hypothetical protein
MDRCRPTTYSKEFTMNRKTLVTAAIVLCSAGSSFATTTPNEIEVASLSPVASVLTRSQVHAAALQARHDGQIVVGEGSVVLPTLGSGLTRAQVHAETLEAIRLGAISRGEHNSFPTQMQLDSIRMAGLRAVTMTLASR